MKNVDVYYLLSQQGMMLMSLLIFSSINNCKGLLLKDYFHHIFNFWWNEFLVFLFLMCISLIIQQFNSNMYLATVGSKHKGRQLLKAMEVNQLDLQQ